jgi:tripartite-type tricarboxylate transporter receptor subunit TctC
MNQSDVGHMRLIEPFGAGGGPDIVARTIARPLSERLGRQVDVLNHAGGGSTEAPALVLAAPADGDTLLINTSAHAYSAVAVRDLPYDPLKDFVAVAPLTTQAYVVVAGRRAGISSLEELIRSANARRGPLRFGSSGVGTGTHIGTELLNRAIGINATHVPADPRDAIADVVAKVVRGTTDYAMSPISAAAGPLAAGDLVALGVTTAQRSPALPQVPTLAEAGAASYDFPIWYGAWARADTPPAIVDGLTSDIAAAIAHPDVRELLASHGMQPLRMTRAEFSDFVDDEARRASQIIKTLGSL